MNDNRKDIVTEKKSIRIIIFSYLGVIGGILLDQITKYLAYTNLRGQDAFVIIPNVFELRYLENQSAAFSFDPISLLHKIFHISYFDAHPDAFLTCKMVFFVAMTVIVLVLLAVLYRRIPWNRHWLPMNLILLGFMAGAIGNLIDRIVHRFVIDFFYFRLINFPIFNVADIYVTIAAIALMIAIFFIYSEKDFNSIFPSKKKSSDNTCE